MYKQCFLKSGISEILFYKRLDQAFALKHAAELFKSKLFNQPSYKTFRKNQKINQVFQQLVQIIEKLRRMFKSSTTCLCYITTSAVIIRSLFLFSPVSVEKFINRNMSRGCYNLCFLQLSEKFY